MSAADTPERPRLRVVQGGREPGPDAPGKPGKPGAPGKPRNPRSSAGAVDIDAAFVGERVFSVVDAAARPAPKALTAGPQGHVSEDMPEEAGRRLAPGAPLSPGTVPLELALHLRAGEALVWWDAKAAIDFRLIFIILGACLLILFGVTALSSDFWSQPWGDLWPPVAALMSPALLVLVREQLSLRSLMVTDTAIIEVTRRGEVSRLVFSAIRSVHRDIITGGVLLQGKGTRIRVPPALVEDARAAIVTQRRSVLRGEASQPDDPLRWLP